MRMRLSLLVILVGLGALPSPARSADEKPSGPAIVLRLRSIDSLINDAKFLAGLVGREEEAKQFDALLKARTGPQGIEGIDPKRPLGVFGTIAPNVVDSTVVVLLPVADEKALLGLLENFNLKPKQEAGGIYALTSELVPFPIYFRVANQYAYVTIRDKGPLAKDKLLDPRTVLPADQRETLSASLRIDQIPATLKQIAIGQIELQLANLQDSGPVGETKAEREFRVQTLKEVARQLTSLIRDGGELGARLDFDQKAGQVVVELSLAGKPQSGLATALADFGKSQSLFTGVIGPNSALNALGHVSFPEALRNALGAVVDDAIQKNLEKEKDRGKREQASRILKALTPSLKSGELDAVFDLRGPTQNNHYALVAGIKVRDGREVEKALRDLVGTLPEGDRAKIKLDSETVSGIQIHRIDAQKELDEKARQAFGANPMYVAIRSDAAFVVLGEGGLEVLKQALLAKPKNGPQLQFEVHLARLATAMAQEQKGAPKAALEAFGGQDKNNDKIRVFVEGGQSLKVRLEIKAKVLSFLALLDQKKGT